ncbi:unnamed protein product [Mycena citricolor]|uniref:Uncharacterized protein n=1 Tax=Mycena citricolor TaxID=2018698 RepID=A0AAD2JX98_9AGAR|nr:unnamed protein product [Mycena citricolor]
MARKKSARAQPVSEEEGSDGDVEESGDESSGTRAVWTDPMTEMLLDRLIEEKAKSGNGGNFTPTTYRVVATDVDKHRVSGAVINGASVIIQLRSTHSIINKIRDMSGFKKFTLEHGAGVDDSTKDVWDKFVLKYPAAATFRSTGWQWLEQMDKLKSKKSGGGHACYRASPASAVPLNAPAAAEATNGPAVCRPESPTWDIENPSGTLPDEDTAYKTLAPPSTPAGPLLSALAAPASTPINSGHKRALSETPESAEPAKHFISIFGDVRDIMAGGQPGGSSQNQPSPQRRRGAIQRAQQLETDLDDDDMVILIEILGDVNKADTYSVLTNPAVRIRWVQKQITDYQRMHAGGAGNLFGNASSGFNTGFGFNGVSGGF